MFAKVTIIFVIFFQFINGSQLERAQVQFDVDFLSSRIVGGEDAPDGYANYMVALVTGSWMKFLVCGGSIISKCHVLTAAHCIEPFVTRGVLSRNIQGVIGSNYWNSSNIIEFKDFIIHDKWDWATIKNDIGILTTVKKIEFTDRIGAISLNFDFIGGGVESFVTGWGLLWAWGVLPYRLQLLNVKTINPKDCIELVKQASLIWGSAPPVDPALEICTFHSTGHGMCNGDSGSALVLKKSREQIGIVSWGFQCALGVPDMFARISGFKDFLLASLRKCVD